MLHHTYTWLLSLLWGRSTVTPRVVQAAVGTLREVLKKKEFSSLEKITDPVATAIVQEALRNAAEKEDDKQPRMNAFYDEIEHAAESIIASFRGDTGVDPRIRGILAFHHVL